MRRGARSRIARRVGAGVLALAAGVTWVAPTYAEENRRGWLGAIVDFLTRPEGAPVDVPLRKQAGPEAPRPAAAPEVAPPETPETGEFPPPAPPAASPERLVGATLADVHRAVEALVADIEILREASGADDAPPDAALLEDRAPVHVYVKTLEVWGRVAEVQRRLGLPAGALGRIPSEGVGAPDLLAAVEHTRAALATLAAHAGVEPGTVPAAAPAAAPTPSALYRRLAHASALLDALAGGPLTSDDVHRAALAALGEVAAIAGRLEVALDPEPPPPAPAAKRPLDVAQQLLRALYKAVALQGRLHMDASRVPGLSLERASPPENCDLVGQLRAELARIGWHLGIDEVGPAPPAPAESEGADGAFAAIQRIVRTLDRLADAAPE